MTKFTERFLDDVQQTLAGASALLPRQELNAALQAALRKMDIVTREEFDAQSTVLARTRARLEVIEAELITLKEMLNQQD